MDGQQLVKAIMDYYGYDDKKRRKWGQKIKEIVKQHEKLPKGLLEDLVVELKDSISSKRDLILNFVTLFVSMAALYMAFFTSSDVYQQGIYVFLGPILMGAVILIVLLGIYVLVQELRKSNEEVEVKIQVLQWLKYREELPAPEQEK